MDAFGPLSLDDEGLIGSECEESGAVGVDYRTFAEELLLDALTISDS